MTKKVRKWSQNKKFSTAEKRLHNLRKGAHNFCYRYTQPAKNKYRLKGEEE